MKFIYNGKWNFNGGAHIGYRLLTPGPPHARDWRLYFTRTWGWILEETTGGMIPAPEPYALRDEALASLTDRQKAKILAHFIERAR